jgi:hypothetical protein
LWRDTTTATPVLALAQAKSQGFIPSMPQLPQITTPPLPPPIATPIPSTPIQPSQQQELALPAPPITVNFGHFMRGLAPQEFTKKSRYTHHTSYII